jgi:hypothetical protein
MIVSVIVAVLNALGALLPQLPGLIDEIRGHPNLNPAGKTALELTTTRVTVHEANLAHIEPLKLPESSSPAPSSSTPSAAGSGTPPAV